MMVLDADYCNAGILDTHIGVTSFMATMVIADDDLSWWSEDFRKRRKVVKDGAKLI